MNLPIVAKFSEIYLAHDEATNITELIINNAVVYYLPSNIADVFPNLTRLNVVNSSLKEIHKEDFQNLTVLTALDLSGNELTTLEENLFEFIPRMIIIWLQGNFLSTIHPNVFDLLRNLQDLQLHGNPCIQEDVRSVKMMILEVRKNCTPIATSSMISLLNKGGVDDNKTLAVLLVVIGGMFVAIILAIILRMRLSRWEYDVSKGERNRHSDASDVFERERKSGSINYGMVL